ncbi:serine hydrolase domain-containing protein [Alkalihalobacterium elongatum]|uniref:serine hydrolase domain-containing protein n=1 Tax=Alkalihalobacterium elongatum TaxID=2675466 RepID=UPI001C20022C|nr:serine hydrolase domain-containing protein [Alkalihalobacterium elongatum]
MKNNILTKVLCGLLILSFLPFYSYTAKAASSKQFIEEQLDEYIQETVNILAIPGMSIAISHRGDVIYSRVFGEDIDTNTRFYIGSTTKTFTALAIMQLVEKGRIDLDQSVSAYLEEFTVSDKITVRQLLHHVSGMTEFDYMGNLSPQSQFPDLIEDMNTMSLTYEPGELFSYFNPNYSLLGAIVERVSGQSYTEYIMEHIIHPLNLDHTSVTGEVDTPGHLSFFGFSIKRTEPHLKYDLPAGFITSTSEDLVRFLEALRMKKPAVGVSPGGIEQMMFSGSFYGMGLMKNDISGRPAIHHGGALPGYTSNAIMLVEDEYSIAFLINKNHLVNGFVFYPDLTNGIVSILTDQEPASRVDYYWMYRLLIILFAATIIYNLIRISKMIFRPKQKTIRQRITAGLVNLVIPIAILVFIPILVPIVLQRGMTWELAFLLLPDMLIWLFLAIAFHFIKSIIHFSQLFKHYFNVRKTNIIHSNKLNKRNTSI